MNTYILLDRSGSMQSLWEEAVGSINAYVNKLDSNFRVILAVFDDQDYQIVRDSKVSEWKIFEHTELAPRGMTPLYDSCAKLVHRAMEDNPDKAMLLVMTDGEENSSQEYNNQQIKALLDRYEAKGYDLTFMGANFDNDRQASSLGRGTDKTLRAGRGRMHDSMVAMAANSMMYATTGVKTSYSVADKAFTSGINTTQVNTSVDLNNATTGGWGNNHTKKN